MFWRSILFNPSLCLELLLISCSIIGDIVVTHSESNVLRAVADNVTHSIIAAVSWLIVAANTRDFSYTALYILLDVGLCALIASLIDLDHFLSARSFNLKAAVKLKNRPILHCSTIPIVVTTLLLTLSRLWNSTALRKATLIFFIAFGSHHIRDATRRGIWIFPFGSTPPIPYYLYIAINCSLPYLVNLVPSISVKHSTYLLDSEVV